MPDRIDERVQELLAAPLGEIIAAVGRGVGEAQAALDRGALEQVLQIYGEGGAGDLALLREIGYRPTFYALPETTGEVQVSLTLSGSGGAQAPSPATPAVSPAERRSLPGRKPVKFYGAPANAAFSNRYNYASTAAATLKFKIVPVPAPNRADELRVVPSFDGHNVADAEAALVSLGLDAGFRDPEGNVVERPEGSATVAAQVPEPGAYLLAGDRVLLTIGS